MSLSVLVESASGLPNVDTFSKSDPMCVIVLEGKRLLCQREFSFANCSAPSLAGEKKRTDVKKDDLDPQWNEVN